MTNQPKSKKSSSRAPAANSRGIALVTTLLLLSLMIAMTLAMVVAVSSDTLITRYYRNFRSSFYAADSGANVVRQYMLNQLKGDIVSGAIAANAAPLSGASILSTISSNALSLYGSSGLASNRQINSGQGAGSWPGSFQVSSVTLGTAAGGTNPSGSIYCQASGGTPPNPSCSSPAGNPTLFTYTFPYSITITGQSLASEQTTITDSGNFTINVPITSTSSTSGSTTVSFSAWGTFLDQYPECSSPFAPGTLSGPFFTNGAWTFEPGTYNFTGSVGSVSTTFGYYYGSGSGNCVASANPSYKKSGTTIAPNFENGYALGAAQVALPVNDYNQKEAVVDGMGNTWSAENLTNAQQDALMNASLKTVDGTSTPYPTAGTTNPGVYLPFSQTTSGSTTTNTMTGGGIYVEGDANVEVVATTATVGTHTDSVQQIVITQGTSPSTATTTITIDPTANTTSVSQAVTSQSCTTTGTPPHQHTTCTNSTTTSTTSISGVPENRAGTTPTPATMLYVDGNINSLSGPGQGQAGIQNGEDMTITAKDNVEVTGDVLYASEPVTTAQNQVVNGTTYPNVDTLIPGSNSGVLGIFTATGNVQMNNSQSNGNIELDASIAMISQGGSGGWTGTSGNNINTVTLVGGRIASTAMACYCNSRNLYFDQRFAGGTFAPPWFPSTTLTGTTTTTTTYATGTVSPTTQRMSWAVANY